MGSLLLDLGASTMIMYGFRERENALQLYESLCGARMTFNYIKPGGVREDLPDGFIPKLNEFIKDMEKRIVDYEELVQRQRDILNEDEEYRCDKCRRSHQLRDDRSVDARFWC